MTWAEKFSILKQTLNWPAVHMMEYIDAGYMKNAYRRYNDVANDNEDPSDYLVQCICQSFYVNPAWMYEEEGPILLDERRVRSELNVIRQRAKRDGVLVTLNTLKRVADNLDVGLEWLLCGDETAKENPVNDSMISFLQDDYVTRRKIWSEMEAPCNDEFYERLVKAINTQSPKDALARTKLLNAEIGISQNQFCKQTNICIQNIKKLNEIQICKVATFGAVSRDWIRTGNTTSLAWPCDQKMIIWLREHPEIRADVAKKMNGAGVS